MAADGPGTGRALAKAALRSDAGEPATAAARRVSLGAANAV